MAHSQWHLFRKMGTAALISGSLAHSVPLDDQWKCLLALFYNLKESQIVVMQTQIHSLFSFSTESVAHKYFIIAANKGNYESHVLIVVPFQISVDDQTF